MAIVSDVRLSGRGFSFHEELSLVLISVNLSDTILKLLSRPVKQQ
jgi:hypothetical protein